MRIKLTAPRTLRQTIALPASKSISNRALIIHALANGGEMPKHISDCDDTFVMLRALTQPSETVDIMAAGTAMRFLTAYYSVTAGTHLLTGTERMKQRPIGILTDALRQLGARIEYAGQEGFPPLRITGSSLEGGPLSLPGGVSSQYISALLMTGPVLRKGLELELTGDIISRPYIDMTLKLMADYGAQARWTDERHIRVEPSGYRPIPYYIESDWSAASYWYAMTALSSDTEASVVLPGLDRNSPQGDSAVQHLFADLGVRTEFFRNEDGLECARLTKCAVRTKCMEYDFVNQPDLAQTFAVTCALLDIPFRFSGLQSLKIKETDRMAALICELGKLGYAVKDANDAELTWDGTRTQPQPQPAIDTYEDHRMAMAFAPCCMVRPDIVINNPQVVSKSYPQFWTHLQQCGFEIDRQ